MVPNQSVLKTNFSKQQDFPGDPVKTLLTLQGGMTSIPGQGTRIPQCHAAWPKNKNNKANAYHPNLPTENFQPLKVI